MNQMILVICGSRYSEPVQQLWQDSSSLHFGGLPINGHLGVLPVRDNLGDWVTRGQERTRAAILQQGRGLPTGREEPTRARAH
jgi:hypothetical protein